MNDFNEFGTIGLSRWGGQVYEEWEKALQGIQGIRIYKEMADSDVVGAMLYAVKMLCRQVSWKVEAADDSEEARKYAEFVHSCMHDMSHSWDDFINEVLSMLVFGFSVHEIVYKRRNGVDKNPPSKYDDGLIGWRKLPIRAQETIVEWLFDEEGGIKGIVQIAPPDFRRREIPIEKLLLFRTDTSKGNPMGRSLLRNAYRPYYFKKQIEILEGIGIERDLAGLPVAWVPPNIVSPTTDEEKQAYEMFKKLVQSVRRDEREGIVMPLAYDEKGNKLYDFTLLTTGGSRQFDTNAIVKRYDFRIAQTILADFILLGSEKMGSYAMAEIKMNAFTTAIASILGGITSVLNTYAIPRLLKINGFNVLKAPRIVHGPIMKPSAADLSRLLEILAKLNIPLNAGAVKDLIASYLELPIETKVEETATERTNEQEGGKE